MASARGSAWRRLRRRLLLLAEQAIVAARSFVVGSIVMINAASATGLRAADPMQGMMKLLSAPASGGTAGRGHAGDSVRGGGVMAGKRGLGLSVAKH